MSQLTGVHLEHLYHFTCGECGTAFTLSGQFARKRDEHECPAPGCKNRISMVTDRRCLDLECNGEMICETVRVMRTQVTNLWICTACGSAYFE